MLQEVFLWNFISFLFNLFWAIWNLNKDVKALWENLWCFYSVNDSFKPLIFLFYSLCYHSIVKSTGEWIHPLKPWRNSSYLLSTHSSTQSAFVLCSARLPFFINTEIYFMSTSIYTNIYTIKVFDNFNKVPKMWWDRLPICLVTQWPIVTGICGSVHFFSIKELTTTASTPKSTPSWCFTSLLTWTFSEFWCGPIDLCYFSPSAAWAEWLSLVVILKGSVPEGCAGSYGAGSPGPASTQRVPNQKQYTQ